MILLLELLKIQKVIFGWEHIVELIYMMANHGKVIRKMIN